MLPIQTNSFYYYQNLIIHYLNQISKLNSYNHLVNFTLFFIINNLNYLQLSSLNLYCLLFYQYLFLNDSNGFLTIIRSLFILILVNFYLSLSFPYISNHFLKKLDNFTMISIFKNTFHTNTCKINQLFFSHLILIPCRDTLLSF